MGAKKIRHCGIDRLKKRYGLIMISPWILGMLLFFIIPIFQSVYFSFSDVGINVEGTTVNFTKLENYKTILFRNPDYVKNLMAALKNILTSLPFILVVSMVLALLLNGKFKGRLFYRGLYFLPAIIASGIVLKLYLVASASSSTKVVVSDVVSFDMMFDFTKILSSFNLPSGIQNYLSSALSNVFMLIWQSGIQTILIVAGLQAIPDLLYEVAKVEGATKWEELWYVTFPMLGRTILLVLIFTIVELTSSDTNEIMAISYQQMQALQFGMGSAMLWFYYLIIGIIVSLLLYVYNKAFLKRWG